MKNKRLNLVLGITTVACGLVAIFTMFANAFADVDDLGDARGSVFNLMFRYDNMGYNCMPWLIVLFVFLVCATTFAIATIFVGGKIGALINGVDALLFIASAIILFLTKQIFIAAGTQSGAPIYDVDSIKLGVGTILPAIFALIAAVISLYTAYSDFKA